ncbi:hypothetical protein HY251_21730 [bacterium]|nr:hypothetical protein [bacterium]
MSHRKLGSRLVDKAARRLAGLKAIDPELVLEHGVSTKSVSHAQHDLLAHLESYNTKLSDLDAERDAVKAAEKVLRDQLERALAGVITKFGKDSEEYKAAGGVKRSDRKRFRRKPPASPSAPPSSGGAAKAS